MMLALANAPRFIGHNAEEIMRRACDKFGGRFDAVERLATLRNLTSVDVALGVLESLWQEAKRIRRSNRTDAGARGILEESWQRSHEAHRLMRQMLFNVQRFDAIGAKISQHFVSNRRKFGRRVRERLLQRCSS